MEVELDVEAPRETWRSYWSDWGRFCQRVWMCREDKLFKDEPMAPSDWEKHLSWRRHCIEPRVFARVFHVLSVVELWILAVSLFAAFYATYVEPLPGALKLCSRDYMILFQLTSFALALLMVFRTNTAHARWWEARTAIGRWLNVHRNSQRMMLTWAPPSDLPLVFEFARWNAALTAAAAAYLCRKPAYLDRHCADLLSADELAWLAGCSNAPVKVLMIMSELVKRSGLTPFERAEVERELSAFDIALGANERITRQAIPMAYTRHTSRCIISYLTFLPFGLWSYMGWWMISAMVGLTFLLVGIENIGVQIENPVMVLPMNSFSVGNKAAVLAMVKAHATVSCVAQNGLSAAKGLAADGIGAAELLARFESDNGGGGGSSSRRSGGGVCFPMSAAAQAQRMQR